MKRLAVLALLWATHALGQPVGGSSFEPDEIAPPADAGASEASALDGGLNLTPTPIASDAGPALPPPAQHREPPSPPSAGRSPGFTQDQQFTNARLWVLDPGHYTVEQWWTGDWGIPRALAGQSNQDEQLLQTALAIGLLPHLQLDLSVIVDLNEDVTGNTQFSPYGLTGIDAEARIAIGRFWGQIWGNPTLDLEIDGRFDAPTRLEARLLMGGELAPKLLAVVNFLFARDAFWNSTIGIDYEAKAYLGINTEIIPDILRIGMQATVGWDSHDQIYLGRTPIYPVAQVGPAILITDPKKRIKLLAGFLYGLADWDAPYESQLLLSSTF